MNWLFKKAIFSLFTMIWAMVGSGLQLIEQVIWHEIKKKNHQVSQIVDWLLEFNDFFSSLKANKDLSLKIFSGIWSKTLTPMLFFPGSIGFLPKMKPSKCSFGMNWNFFGNCIHSWNCSSDISIYWIANLNIHKKT